ncbi:MAG: LysR family transcriptional regulator, partial [Rhodoferax sp.]|nr:LysR family transcriptional regulator [Rhodoferax sp.]
PQVVLEADRIGAVMRTIWSRYGLRTDVLLRTTSLEAVRSLVGVGAGITILPDFLYRPWTLDADHIEARKLRDEIPSIDIGLVWRRGSRPREVVSEFIETAREQSQVRHAAR